MIDMMEDGYEFIMQTIYYYQRTISDLLIVENNEQLFCCLLGPSDGKLSSDNKTYQIRYELHFPFLKTDRSFQIRQIHPKAASYLRNNNI